MAIAGSNCYHFGFLFTNKMESKKEKIVKEKLPTAEEFLKNSNATGMAFNREAIQEAMIEFAKLHVAEAIEKASKGFKNPDNIRFVKKCYPLDGIV